MNTETNSLAKDIAINPEVLRAKFNPSPNSVKGTGRLAAIRNHILAIIVIEIKSILSDIF